MLSSSWAFTINPTAQKIPNSRSSANTGVDVHIDADESPQTTCESRGRPPWLFLRCAGLGGESGVDRHVDMNRLVSDNRERLCSHVEAPAHPSFCIKDVSA